MAIKDDKFTLSTTAELLVAGGSVNDPKTVIIKNPSATIFIGGPTVTAADGFPVATTDVVTLVLGHGDDLYAIASAGTPTVNVLATRSNARVGTGD